MNSDNDCRKRGLKAFQDVTGIPGTAVMESFAEIAPELGQWIVDFSYGEVLSRPHLDLRTRQLVTVAALTVMGKVAPQLKLHIGGSLNVGCEPKEIIEVILQMSIYAGFPVCINAINIAREVFKERGISVNVEGTT
ncbi:MAG: carboxymuconolactone decarboxylase family protein [Syntrophales bacterium]|jgi:4-carboxymuconolactone decarboxylase